MTMNTALLHSFQAACQRAVRILQDKHGYSRDRAKQLVWYELLSDSNTSPEPKDPEQVFAIMRSYSLEWDQAVQALTIAQAVRNSSHDNTDVFLHTWMERLNTLEPRAVVPTAPPSRPRVVSVLAAIPISEMVVQVRKKRALSEASVEEETTQKLPPPSSKRQRVRTMGAHE